MPDTKDVCPVCGGRKLAYDTDRFEWGPEKCKACDGTGEPLWKKARDRKRGEANDGGSSVKKAKKLIELFFWIAGVGLYILSMIWCFTWRAPVYPGIVGGVGICFLLIALGFMEERRRTPDLTSREGWTPPPLHHNCRCAYVPLEDGESLVWKNGEGVPGEKVIHIGMEALLKRTTAITFQIHQIVETPSTWDVRLGPDADDPQVSMSKAEFSTRPKLGGSILVIPPKVLGYLPDNLTPASTPVEAFTQELLRGYSVQERDTDERE